MARWQRASGKWGCFVRCAWIRAAPAFCCLLLAAGGCGRPSGPIFEPLAQPLVWPSPPDPARIHYIGALATDRDLRRGRTLGQAIGAVVFGREPARAMVAPADVVSDGRRIMVCDSSAQCVHVFDLEARRYDEWRVPPEHGAFAQPVGIAYDNRPGESRLLVADSSAGALFAFDARGRGLGWLGGEHLMRPTGIAVDPDRNRILVADAGLHQVVVLTDEGELIARIGARGSGPAEFNFPTSITVAPEGEGGERGGGGRIYVSDSLNFRIQVFDAELQYIGQIGQRGNRPGHFSQPKGVTVDRHGHVYIVDSHFEAVQIFDWQGQLLLSFGQEGRGHGEFWLPAGIFAAPDDRIWVADTHNRRVQVFEYRGSDGATERRSDGGGVGGVRGVSP